MKKLILTLAAIVLVVSAFAQNRHLKFKGIPIDGSLTNFVTALKGAGYQLIYQSEDGGAAALEGSFTNEDVTIVVVTTPKTNTVWKVAVLFEDQSSWSSLKSDYKALKANLAAKYGAPDSAYEFFSSPYEEGDGYEMTAIYAEKCTYMSFFHVKSESGEEVGTIWVEIAKNETKGRISLAYEDAANSNLKQRENDAIVYDDL